MRQSAFPVACAHCSQRQAQAQHQPHLMTAVVFQNTEFRGPVGVDRALSDGGRPSGIAVITAEGVATPEAACRRSIAGGGPRSGERLREK